MGNAELVGSLTTIKGYLDYGIFGPAQLAAATALAKCDADVAENRQRYEHRARLLVEGLAAAGWTVPMPKASMFVWAPLPASHKAMGAIAFAAALLQESRVAVSPGEGFGPGGAGLRALLAGRGRRPGAPGLRRHRHVLAQGPLNSWGNRRFGEIRGDRKTAIDNVSAVG